MNKKLNTSVINFRVSNDLHDAIEGLSMVNMMPISIICRIAITEYVKQQSLLHMVDVKQVSEKAKEAVKPTEQSKQEKEWARQRQEYEAKYGIQQEKAEVDEWA